MVATKPDIANLISWWAFDEASGVRYDAHGSNNLADTGTVGYAAGKISNAADFVRASTDYVDIADNASLSTGDIDFTLITWIYLDDDTNLQDFWTKASSGASGDVEYTLRYDNGADRFSFVVGGSGYNTVDADNLGAPSTGTWYQIIAWHDSTANTINIQVNNGVVDSVGSVSPPNDTAGNMTIGQDHINAGRALDGRMDETIFAKRVYTSGEREWFWNSGDGRAYSELSAIGGIAEINGVAWASIAEVNGVAVASIAEVSGVEN